MPTYVFRCEYCGNQKEVVRLMRDTGLPVKCPRCDQSMRRDWQAERVNIGDKEYARPIHSDSLAIMPSQVEEHKRLYPDIELDSEHRPVFDNYRKHDSYLKKTGFRKQRQRIRKKGRRIK